MFSSPVYYVFVVSGVSYIDNKELKADLDIKPTSTDMLPPLSEPLSLNEPQNHAFKLAPTPAQLGKAPLQRRLSMGKSFC